jgi:Ca2+-binding EF-hand superfamily protein
MDNTELRQSFDYFHRDHNGSIDFGKFCELPDTLNSGMEEGIHRIGFDMIDSDDNGAIDFEEFAGCWRKQA